MNRKPLLLVVKLILSLSIFSQTKDIRLSGKLTDNSHQPIEFVNVSILSSDSSFVIGTTTATDGKFSLTLTQPADYIAKFKYISYKDTYVTVTIANLIQSFDMGEIVLYEDTKSLKEVEIIGDRIINKVDRQITMPTELQIKTSVQGIDLLSKLNIPEIVVDPVNRTITSTDGSNVQLRINGIRVSSKELAGINADEVLRVETYNGLNARFGGEDASIIIDIILKRKQTGGYVMTDLQNAPFTGFGNDLVSAKLNYKDSQFGLMYYLSYRDYKNRYTNRTTEFNFPDNSFSRQQDGIKTPFNYQMHNINLTYNLTSTDKYALNIEFRNEIFSTNNNYRSKSYYSNTGLRTFSNTINKGQSYTPVLDLFFKYKLSARQNLMANLVGTYIDTNNKRNYTEYTADSTFLDIYNRTQGKKKSLIAEAVYENRFNDKLSLNAGVNNAQGYADNTVIQDETTVVNMYNANTYLFAQLQGVVGKVNYTVGIGGSRIWFRESDSKYTFYVFRPTVQLAYKPANNFSMRYNFTINAFPPSLSQLNGVLQRVDSLQSSQGNPNLHPYKMHNNIITLNYNKGRVNMSLNLRHNYYDNPIMNDIQLADGLFVSTYDNQTKLVRYGTYANMQVQLIKDIWSIGGTGGIDHFHSQGANYSHYHTASWGNVNTNASYHNFDLTFGINFRTSSLWGETITYGENFQYIDLGYKYKSLRLGAGILYPFVSQWSAGYKNLSEVRPETSWSYIPDNGHMLYLHLSWNMSFGKKYEATKKSLNNSDKDTGIRGLD